MKILLSLPPNLVNYFHEIEHVNPSEWFCTSDPVGNKLGSGGGTIWLLESCQQTWNPQQTFDQWLLRDKRILIHAGGQSRRLPAYAPSGKILTPIPVFRWGKGQCLKQNLLSLQLPLYQRIIEKAPDSIHTLIASGDIYIRNDKPLPNIPEADVVCYGLWMDPNLAKNHGVFVSSRQTPDKLDFMMQKPSAEELNNLIQTHLFLMDIGIWLLSDRAVKLLRLRSKQNEYITYYDLYADFGRSLGDHPTIIDKEIQNLKVAIIPLSDGEFYHYGTSHELLSSTVAIQNRVNDQRKIKHLRIKPHPAIFVQNADINITLKAENSDVWIENSCVGKDWQLTHQHIITGIPQNTWKLSLPIGVCIDVIPIEQTGYVARCYGFHDTFKGNLCESTTLFMGRSIIEWLTERKLKVADIEHNEDLQAAQLYPICMSTNEIEKVFRWMINEPTYEEGGNIWKNSRRISADEISTYANLHRLTQQRDAYRAKNWVALAKNYERSVFYQLNLKNAAEEFAANHLPIPEPLPEQAPLMTRIHDQMFRSQLLKLQGKDGTIEEQKAFQLLREGLISTILAHKQRPHMAVYADQIVWSRSPVRIDLAGGWTDTPPYCLNEGGNVVNMAIELNGQPPLQAYVKSCKEYKIVLRSIDLGDVEEVHTYEELRDFIKVGSPFSIPKAALVLAGFQPGFSLDSYPTLKDQLHDFGCGIEVTLLSAVPAGSGLGASSILASTVLGAIADYCGLTWDKNDICRRTLVLEQLLTTGGGWQDQYGGVLHGIKLLQTSSGFDQSPVVRWLPNYLFTEPEYQKCHLLYYTGITRTAKNILAEIVRGMFLNSTDHLTILNEMKTHTWEMFEAIQRGNFKEFGQLVGKSWKQNKQLDSGTNPPSIEAIIRLIHDFCYGYKLPGAGGGGFLYMVAKDQEAASRIKQILTETPPNTCARFVEMSLSDNGLKTSRS